MNNNTFMAEDLFRESKPLIDTSIVYNGQTAKEHAPSEELKALIQSNS